MEIRVEGAVFLTKIRMGPRGQKPDETRRRGGIGTIRHSGRHLGEFLLQCPHTTIVAALPLLLQLSLSHSRFPSFFDWSPLSVASAQGGALPQRHPHCARHHRVARTQANRASSEPRRHCTDTWIRIYCGHGQEKLRREDGADDALTDLCEAAWRSHSS